MPIHIIQLAAVVLLTLLPSFCHADILIGQTAAFTGASSVSVKECTDGANLYINSVNAKGGVFGQRIKLISLDDGIEPERSVTNAKVLLDQGVLALFLTRGTPNTLAILPLLDKYQTPLVAPSTGAMPLHKPVNQWVFNVRTSYQREAERVVQHLQLIGLSKLAIIQVDDSFGSDAVQGALRALSDARLAPVSHMRFDRAQPKFSSWMNKVVDSAPQAVLFIGSAATVADGIAQLRASGSRAQAVTLSNNASAGFIKALGVNSRGVVVSQVFPYERSTSLAFVREAMDLAKSAGNVELTPQSLEGFAAAKVLVEALRRAGPKPTRQILRAALDGMRSYDLGGLSLGYNPSSHSGLDFVDLAIIDSSGRYMR